MTIHSEETPQDVGSLSDWFESRPINKQNRDLLAQAVHNRLSFVGLNWATLPDAGSPNNSIKMLDYACGPGLLTRIFGPYVSSITAIDISPEMVERYKQNTTTFGLPPEKISILAGNLLTDTPEPASLSNGDYYNFDLITVGAALHHFPSATEAIRHLSLRLKPGGVLFIQDLYDSRERKKGDTKGEGMEVHGERPPGYTEEGLKGIMEGAGLKDFRMEVLPGTFEVELPSKAVLEVEFFIARASNPHL